MQWNTVAKECVMTNITISVFMFACLKRQERFCYAMGMLLWHQAEPQMNKGDCVTYSIIVWPQRESIC